VSPRTAGGRTRKPGADIPGVGAFAALAFVVVLVPAILVTTVLHAVGASLAVACMLGLLTAFLGMGAYPRVLRLLKWLPPRARS
jgi:Flp pilus assembly protein TadB